ncbi:hypothetical protein [Orrella marina]|uniref:Uncharacterized protein n=1 Tax=Orrella marina TaxID=2163011 RepID=A0A2R4XNX9_9BURK|nr:hypothetical protein [Orrella marina]AWB35512.1 hypothetical protein DBV39_19160 [Orrella marina]
MSGAKVSQPDTSDCLVLVIEKKRKTFHQGKPPTPRLRHVQPGQIVYLAHEDRPRLLLDMDDHFGYFEGLQASIGHEVKETGMVFGEGGWRVE